MELPAGWAWAQLGELGEYVNGRGFKKSEWSDTGRPIIRIQNLTGSGTNFNHYAGDLDARHTVPPGTLLISWAATLGVFVWRGPEAALNQHIFKVKAFVDQEFLRHLIDHKIRELVEASHGSGMVHVTRAKFDELAVAIPPLNEQIRITESLESKLSRIQASGHEIITARKKISSLRKAILLTLVPEVAPDSWEMTTVENAGTVGLGRQRHPDWHHGPEMHPYLRVANVFEDRIDTSDVMEMDFSGVFERFRLEPGDVLLNEGQSPHLVGRPALYRGTPPDVAFTNSLIRFRARPDVMPEWALMVFRRHLHARRFMREVRITTNIAHLSSKRLKAVEFPIPPLEEQKRLVQKCDELMSNADAMDRALERNVLRAKRLRDSVLNHAFTGQLVPQDPADEPASVLLDRIRAERAAAPKPQRTRRTRAATTASTPAPTPTPAPRTAIQQEFQL
ncbi:MULTISPECIES: restriction endonuclease subunit S [Streptomyces]|uniref:restriction endonuclease subunit S n=1 Tax=Streptomyces TaxID=1883 RepID=UPI001FFDF3DE|nr:restriction endonuclease subunit S [Streptomyces sp. 4R-3d]